MKKNILHMLVIALMSFGTAAALADEPCRVVDPELRGSYSGACGKDGLAEGIGAAKGSAEYVGEFRAGRKHGHGVKVWPWGDRYVGQFVDDRKEGQGIYVFGAKTPWAGDRYVGAYRADRRQGKGIYEWSSGERYEGTWENDAMTGPATPMALLRAQHLKAVKEAVMKVGVIVCRDLPVGVGNRETARGAVGAVSTADNTIAVVLEGTPTQPINGAMVRAGDTVWDAAINWVPCD